MERQSKANMDGLSSSDVKVEERERERGSKVRYYDMLLRILGLGFTLVAAVVMGVNKETHTLLNTVSFTNFSVTAKWYYLSAFVYFVVTNAIACSYAAASLALSIVSNRSKTLIALLIMDLIMVALLFSSGGAVIGVGVIAVRGNSHTYWNKVCFMVSSFCHQSTASIIISMFGAFVFLCLVALAALNRQHNYR